ncbi:MAG: ATPase [Magnetovibrio sp.]|nr:ATPase [Magnetovibrio sp.]
MSDTRAAGRFYKEAAAVAHRDAFQVALDGRPVKTPGGQPLLLPGEPLAVAVAAEWAAQGEKIQPATMPMMQLACTAVDRVGPSRGAIVRETANYGGNDLLCYRADDPPDLVKRQAEAWQPVLDWLADEMGAPLACTVGVTHVVQPAAALERLRACVAAYDDFQLTGVAQLTQVLGSLALALAVERGRLNWGDAAAASLLDETFQSERWGEDKEARERRRAIHGEAEAAARFLELLGD